MLLRGQEHLTRGMMGLQQNRHTEFGYKLCRWTFCGSNICCMCGRHVCFQMLAQHGFSQGTSPSLDRVCDSYVCAAHAQHYASIKGEMPVLASRVCSKKPGNARAVKQQDVPTCLPK